MEEQLMSKNIVLCSDGTGQAGGQGIVSSVWRLFKAVDRHHPIVKQVVYHADGLGTEKNKFLRVLGGAFGYGIKRDILLLYTILVRTYNTGDNESDPDKVFLFGFSRSAFTVRSLAGMMNHIGILENSKLDAEKESVEAVRKAYYVYTKK